MYVYEDMTLYAPYIRTDAQPALTAGAGSDSEILPAGVGGEL